MNTAPAVVGFLALLGLAGALVVNEPTPGALASAHADLDGTLGTCATCHTPRGLDAGCLGCHHEVARQVEAKDGFHAERASNCAQCHPDHHGESFDVMEAIAWRPDGREAYRHDDVAFALTGRHADLGCRQCHRSGRTYRGLTQVCATCHEDVHGGDLFRDCAACHDQERFKPAARFDHEKFFPLPGRHATATCDKCHGGLDFKDVKGKTCEACHATPHRFEDMGGCEACHGGADASWSVARTSFDAERHARAGFALSAAHVAVACERCHAATLPYAERFREPPRVAKACAVCHEDVHRGQFRASCLDCHEETRFKPARYGRDRHTTFALRGAHAKVECNACHKEVDGTRRFVDTPRACASCHEDPHRGQFRESCDRCHGETSFLPARYPLDRHRAFPLDGAHGAVACNSCHTVVGGARRFAGTPKTCAECHADPHGGQFAPEMKRGGCAACHDTRGFRIRPFDHARRADYPLEGAHSKASCARCHPQTGKPPVRRYRATARNCASCHRDEHRGQFADRACTACHGGFRDWEIRTFDHARTRFPLDGRHRRVSCDDCHPKVRQRDGAEVVQYRPIGRQCKDCHEVERR